LRHRTSEGGERRQSVNYVANASEFYYQNPHHDRSGAAEIHELESRLGNLFAVLMLSQDTFEHRALVAKVNSGKDATYKKSSRKAV
jgi:hypothetical protein